MAKKFEIRNSTAEFLIFQIEGKESRVQVVYHDEIRARRPYITALSFKTKIETYLPLPGSFRIG